MTPSRSILGIGWQSETEPFALEVTTVSLALLALLALLVVL